MRSPIVTVAVGNDNLSQKNHQEHQATIKNWLLVQNCCCRCMVSLTCRMQGNYCGSFSQYASINSDEQVQQELPTQKEVVTVRPLSPPWHCSCTELPFRWGTQPHPSVLIQCHSNKTTKKRGRAMEAGEAQLKRRTQASTLFFQQKTIANKASSGRSAH